MVHAPADTTPPAVPTPLRRIADETLRGDPHSRRLEGMLGLRDPHSASVESLRDPETYPKLVQDSGSEKKGVLPMPAVIKGASGRYRPGEVDNRYRTPRKRLRELKARRAGAAPRRRAPPPRPPPRHRPSARLAAPPSPPHLLPPPAPFGAAPRLTSPALASGPRRTCTTPS